MHQLTLTDKIKNKHLDSYYDAIHDALDFLSRGGVLKYGRNEFRESADSDCVRGLFRLLLSYNETRDQSILVAPPDSHWRLINDFKRYVSVHKWQETASPLRECLHVITWLFSYDRFRGGAGLHFDAKTGRVKGFDSGWSPLKYIQLLGVRYCPYCNAESVYAVKDLNLNARSALDHYFPQSRYPYLAISLCNLVPSCTRCNTDIKKSRELDFNIHAHPFAESMHDGAVFECKPMNVAVALRPEDVCSEEDFQLSLEERLTTGDRVLSTRAVKLGEFFKIKTIYNLLFKREALKAIYRCRIMGSSYYEYVRERLSKNLTDAQIRALFTDAVEDKESINEVRLSKLALDMQEWVDNSTSGT